MSQKSFSDAVKSDAALQSDLNTAVSAAIAAVAKKHGVSFSDTDLGKGHKALTGNVGCVNAAWTAACSI
jgi:hypothetical protein